MKKFFLILVLVSALFSSCGKKSDMDVITEDDFKGNWLVGEWILSGESSDQKTSITIRITGCDDNSSVTVFSETKSEETTFANFKKDFFHKVLSIFPTQEQIEMWELAGIETEYDAKLYINNEKTKLKAMASFTKDNNVYIRRIVLEKKIAQPPVDFQDR